MSRNYSEKPSNGRPRQTSEKTRAAESPAGKGPLGASPASPPSPAKTSIPIKSAAAPAFSQPAAAPATKTATATVAGRHAAPAHDHVSERARAIWMKSGCQPGRDRENWLEAERQLREEMNRR
jgi:hypothetical protein